MKKSLFILLLTLGYVSVTKGQNVLSLVPDAKTSSLGDVGLSQNATPFSLYNYAGAIALDSCSSAIGYSFGGWMPSQKRHNQHSLAGFWKHNKHHGISVGVRYLSYPEINTSDNEGNIEGFFTPYDITLDLGYAYAITSHFSVATTARYITGRISDVKDSKPGSALGLDFGFYFRQNKLNAGIVLSNLGTTISYGGEDNHMPSRIKAAGGYSLLSENRHTVSGVLEIAYAFLPKHYTGFESGIGMEYIYNKIVAVRAGYRLGNSADNPAVISENFGSSLSYTTLGLGLNFSKYSFDASYILRSSESPVRNSFKLSLGVRLY